MFWMKIKEKVQGAVKYAKDIDDCISNYGSYIDCDIDAETAKRNYKTYQNDLIQRQADLIKKWCREINEASCKGEKFIFTDKFITDDGKNKILHLINSANCCCDFPSDATLQYFQRFFEDRGFKVVKIEYPTNNICCLKIIWISSSNN